MIDQSKACTLCGIVQLRSSFHRNPSNSDGLQSRCKGCQVVLSRAYRVRNAEKVRASAARWRADNRERSRANCREWHAANKDHANAYARSYYEQHKDENSTRNKTWREMNPDLVKQYKIDRRATQKRAGGTYTRAEFRALCAAYGDECLACGATSVELVPDHVIALATGGGNGIENIQPLCRPCNSKKNTRTADYRPLWRARNAA